MKFHVLGLPHTQTTRIPSACAYTQKVRKFCDMMFDLGHEVYLYASEENDARVTKHFPILAKNEALNNSPEFNVQSKHWQDFNSRTIQAMKNHAEKGDYLCVIAGHCQAPIAEAYPELMVVEYGIGYDGVFAPYKVFESYAWMHAVYGALYTASGANGRFYDTVIPNYFEKEDFPEGKGGDYLLYVGRMTARKGVAIVEEIGKHHKVIVAGAGEYIPKHCEYVGVVDPAGRAELMGGAKALITPTLYVEPFGGVTIEAMMCGTPVITTDWGAFTETVVEGTGYRRRTLRGFLEATEAVKALDRTYIREYALNNFSTDVIKYKYGDYFNELETLRGDGWYTK